jgi:alpha-aminoadipate/glutamate carrier protein LysW
MTSSIVECVECSGSVLIPSGLMEGEILVCGDCGAELEVLVLNPLTIDLAPRELEDWGE